MDSDLIKQQQRQTRAYAKLRLEFIEISLYILGGLLAGEIKGITRRSRRLVSMQLIICRIEIPCGREE